MPRRPLLLALLLLFSPLGCDPQIPADWELTGADSCRDPAHAQEAYYNDTMLPFFDEYCLACHSSEVEGTFRNGAPETKNFDSFEAARQAPSLTWERVKSQTMPPVGRLPNHEELDRLLDWLNCMSEELEAPERLGECPDGSTVAAADAEAVFAAHCVRCHDEAKTGDDRNGAPDFLNFNTAQMVRDYGDPDFVWQRVWSQEMPDGGPPVPAAEALVVWEWLSCGLP